MALHTYHTAAALAAIAAVVLAPIAIAEANGAGGGFGVAPAHLSYESVLRGEPITRMVTLQNRADTPAEVTISATDGIAHWLHPIPPMHLPAYTTVSVPLVLDVPEGAPHGEHTGTLTATHKPHHGMEEAGGVNMAFEVRIRLSALVDAHRVLDLRAGPLQAAPAEKGRPLDLTVLAENHGNVHSSSALSLSVRTLDDESVHEATVSLEPVPAGEARTLGARIPHALAPGQYRMHAMLHEGEWRLALDEVLVEILEPGTLQRRGEMGPLQTLTVTKEPNHRLAANKPFLVHAPFLNTGEVEVDTRLVGYLLHDGNRVGELETKPQSVPAGESTVLELRVESLRPGTYTFRAHAAYSDRVTPEHEIIINIEEPPPAALQGIPYPAPALGLLLLAAVACVAKRRFTR